MRKMFLAGLTSAFALAAGAAAADPAMWKASDEDSDIWLFGSIHLLDEGAQWKTEALETALKDSDLYYYEMSMSPESQAATQQLIMELGVNQDGKTLSSYLTEEQNALLEEVAGDLGLQVAQMQPLKPWLANLQLSIMAVQKAGYNPESGVEMRLLPETPDDQERFFETGEEQMRFFADMDMNVQVDALVTSLKQLKEDPDMFDRLVTGWKEGDTSVLIDLLANDMREQSPELYDVLIRQRNEDWVEEIDTLMQGDEDALIIVGAGHLVGEDGVPALLEEAGYTVERVQ